MMKVPVKIPSPPIYTNLDICRTKDIIKVGSYYWMSLNAYYKSALDLSPPH